MRKRITVRFIFAALISIFLFLQCGYGQLNIKVGYNLNYSSLESHNHIFSEFNTARPWLTSEFKDIHFSSGLQVGLRYRIDNIALDLTWDRATNERIADGITPAGSDFSKELMYINNRIGLGLESYNKYFGIGANVNYDILQINSTQPNSESSKSIMQNERFASKVYLIFTSIGSDIIAISLQPYVAIPWSHFNLSTLARHLEVLSNEGNIQNNLHFGFSLVFYNGPQQY